MFALSMVLTAFAVIPITSCAEDAQWEPRTTHWNMKENDALHLQTASKDKDETTTRVHADYDQVPGVPGDIPTPRNSDSYSHITETRWPRPAPMGLTMQILPRR